MEEAKLKNIVSKLLAEGMDLTEIQKELTDEYEHKITFLDLRLLASELEDIDWSANEESEPEPEADEKESVEPEVMAAGGTVVEVSKLVRPGAAISGSVKFASGASAEWIIDQMGRLALDKAKGEPTPEDLRQFQEELRRQLGGGM